MDDIHVRMNTPPDWDLYRSFLAVLAEGSLSAAARRLGLTQLTLGPHVEAMAAAAEALLRTASGEIDAARGVVRITTSDIMGAEVLPAILTGFHEQWPEVTIELVLSNRQEDLLRRDADIAVRMARPRQEALVARHVGDVTVRLFAHERYLAA